MSYTRPLPVPPSPTFSADPAAPRIHNPPNSPPSIKQHSANNAGLTSSNQSGEFPPTALLPITSIVNDTMVTGSGSEGPKLCNGCKSGLEETGDSVVVSFGSSLWHVDCRCAKCRNLVEHDTNLLLLSDGSPVCENCSYICSVCQKPISNEAIVTGDESYHADCFRCRSCSNKIEELIFAKTSQGIWCMACHNERVARSRKHAEAKRSRSTRRDKEGRPSRSSRGERNGAQPSPLAQGSEALDAVDSPLSSSSAGALSTSARFDSSRGLSSNLYGNAPSTSTSLSTLASEGSSNLVTGSPSRGIRETFQVGSMPGRPLPRPQPDVPTSASNQSLSGYSPSTSPIPYTEHFPPQSNTSFALATPSHSRQFSNQPELELDRSPAQPYSPKSAQNYTPSPSSSRLDQSENVGVYSATTNPESNRPSLSAHSPLPVHAMNSLSSSSSSSLTLAPPEGNAGLAAPVTIDKKANRRSRVYGGGPKVSDDEVFSSAGEIQSRSRSPIPSGATGNLDNYSDDLETPVVHSSSTPKLSSELHNSISFYDPDTLLFLDHVASEASSKGSTSVSTSGSVLGLSTRDYPIEQFPSSSYDAGELVESLEQRHDEIPSSDEDVVEIRSNGATKSEVSRKLRESIRSSREGSAKLGGGMGLDVDLVEMLLGELDGTKMEMRDLQGKYSAFRRASRSAFEGFSMAREEYDKEVAARREAEARMDVLRTQLTEQALTLAAVDKEQKTAEALKRQSNDLRSSVVGMEKQISQLKAEVQLSTAQVEELASIDPEQNTTADRTAVDREAVAHSLSTRLESVKDEHRREIERLIQQRDELTKEVDDLRETRDIYAEETTILSAKNYSLAEENREASRQLEQLREAASRIRALPSNGNGSTSKVTGHTYSSSSSSNHAPPTPSRSPLSASRATPLVSPSPDHHAIEQARRVNKTEEQHPSVAKKFKWGKGKTETARPMNPPPLPSNSSKAASTGRSAPGASESKSHVFQQTSILRPVRCEYCGDKMWGLNEVRCTVCGCYSHAKCAGYLQGSCSTLTNAEEVIGPNPNGLVMFGNNLSAQARVEDRQVPVVVSKCIAAVEAYGMNYEGIYRKTGGTGMTKLITQYFERGQDFDLEDSDKFNDLAAVTSCMKNFFRTLPDPLFTHDLHEEFVACVQLPDEERIPSLSQTLYKLPEAHFYTARLLMGHLHRVHLRSVENKMTPANLGVVFGPTVLQSINPGREFTDMGFKAKLVELMVEQYPRLFLQPYGSTPALESIEVA